MNYPARGESSADGRYYTHTDGTVHERVPLTLCSKCSMFLADCSDIDCGFIGNHHAMLRLVSGAYVPSAETSEACDMARAMIAKCERGWKQTYLPCASCGSYADKSCPARAYLAKHGAADAWEVKA